MLYIMKGMRHVTILFLFDWDNYPPSSAFDRSPSGRRSPPTRSTRLSRSPVYLREQARTLERNFDREVEMKVKIIENQLYEEKLKQQQKNDEEIQKVSVSWIWGNWTVMATGIKNGSFIQFRSKFSLITNKRKIGIVNSGGNAKFVYLFHVWCVLSDVIFFWHKIHGSCLFCVQKVSGKKTYKYWMIVSTIKQCSHYQSVGNIICMIFTSKSLYCYHVRSALIIY